MFSDEPWLPHAEAKIWTAYGSKQMRYRVQSGNFEVGEGVMESDPQCPPIKPWEIKAFNKALLRDDGG